MIYTVTLNPSLDYIVKVKDFHTGRTNRTEAERICAGGKGINVSLVLKALGVESVAWGFLAGFTGAEIQRQLDEAGVQTDFVTVTEGNSRINWKLTEQEGTEINGQGPEISDIEAGKLLQKCRCLKAGDILFLSGSLPGSLHGDFYGQIMDIASENGATVILDAGGNALLQGVSHEPYLIKPNHYELGEIYGKELQTVEEVIPYGQKLQDAGAKNVLISLAGAGAVLLTENGQVIRANAPQGVVKNAVGAGDAMLAGFMVGIINSGSFFTALQLAVATGSASAFSEAFATMEEIDRILPMVKCELVKTV